MCSSDLAVYSHEMFDSQVEIVTLLAGVAESRSKDTLNHVKRVGHLADLTPLRLRLDVVARWYSGSPCLIRLGLRWPVRRR